MINPVAWAAHYRGRRSRAVKRFKGREPPPAPRGQTEFLFTHNPRRKVVEMRMDMERSRSEKERGRERESEREREGKSKREGERKGERKSD